MINLQIIFMSIWLMAEKGQSCVFKLFLLSKQPKAQILSFNRLYQHFFIFYFLFEKWLKLLVNYQKSLQLIFYRFTTINVSLQGICGLLTSSLLQLIFDQTAFTSRFIDNKVTTAAFLICLIHWTVCNNKDFFFFPLLLLIAKLVLNCMMLKT